MLSLIPTNSNPIATPTLDLTHLTVGHGPAIHEDARHAIHAVAHKCQRSTPCHAANYPYASQRCGPCFDRWLADLDNASYECAADILDMQLDGQSYVDGVDVAGFTPSAADLAEWRVSSGDIGYDEQLSPDEEAMILYSLGDSEWAGEYLDPEAELAELAMDRKARVEMAW